jgi:hypothetical protein
LPRNPDRRQLRHLDDYRHHDVLVHGAGWKMSDSSSLPNIPNPDPSLATNERLANAIDLLSGRMERNREESKGWIEQLQVLLEEKINRSEDKTVNLDRVVQTRLAGSETALNAAMSAADKVTQEIKINFGAVLLELKNGMSKQIESLSEKIDDLKGRMSESGGHRAGITQTATTVIAAIAALASVASVIIVIMKITG